MTFAVKKQNKTKKTQLILSKEKTAINFSTAEPDQKKADDTNRLETPALRKREGEKEAKLETTHHPQWLSSSPLWRKRLCRKSSNTPLISAFVTSDWLRARKSNTNKYRTIFHFLIPYQYVYTNQLFEHFTDLFSIQLLTLLRAFEFFVFATVFFFFLFFPCNHMLI